MSDTLTPFATTPVARDDADFSAARITDPLAGLDEAAIAHCRVALTLARTIAEDLARLAPGDPQPTYDLAGLDKANMDVFAEILGEGEVSILVTMPIDAQAAESVLAGVWRVRELASDGTITRDYIEIGEVPAVVRAAAMHATRTRFHPGQPPEGAMNVMPVLAEISARAARYEPGERNHVISFSLLPMTEQDQAHLQIVLGRGPVHIVSRGYGRCRVMATGVRHVWAVQFFSAAGDVILDTIEIGDVPEAARAAKEDFEDSAARMREIAGAYL